MQTRVRARLFTFCAVRSHADFLGVQIIPCLPAAAAVDVLATVALHVFWLTVFCIWSSALIIATLFLDKNFRFAHSHAQNKQLIVNWILYFSVGERFTSASRAWIARKKRNKKRESTCSMRSGSRIIVVRWIAMAAMTRQTVLNRNGH